MHAGSAEVWRHGLDPWLLEGHENLQMSPRQRTQRAWSKGRELSWKQFFVFDFGWQAWCTAGTERVLREDSPAPSHRSRKLAGHGAVCWLGSAQPCCTPPLRTAHSAVHGVQEAKTWPAQRVIPGCSEQVCESDRPKGGNVRRGVHWGPERLPRNGHGGGPGEARGRVS